MAVGGKSNLSCKGVENRERRGRRAIKASGTVLSNGSFALAHITIDVGCITSLSVSLFS
jgi:hypothetical protein